MATRKMQYRNFNDTCAHLPCADEQFRIDERAFCIEGYTFKHGMAHELERAVNVACAQAEQQTYRGIEYPCIQEPDRMILAPGTVSDDEISVCAVCCQTVDLLNIELTIAVHEKYPFHRCVGESAPECCTVAPVDRMAYDRKRHIVPGLLGCRGGFISAPVIYHEYFIIPLARHHGATNTLQNVRHILRLIECGQDDAKMHAITIREQSRDGNETMQIPHKTFERNLLTQGYRTIIGVDEVGMACLAGPVVVCALAVGPDFYEHHYPKLAWMRDSKMLQPHQRARFARELERIPGLVWRIASCEPANIDEMNVYQASRVAMREAIRKLPVGSCQLPIVLVDGNKTISELNIPQRAIVKGDRKIWAIAAASILAKVHRDALMTDYAKTYPGYGFERHKGYPTALHYAQLAALGPCPLHRRSFRIQ